MTVTTDDLGSARLITWDRQARRNAWDLATMTAIADAMEAAGGEESVRCVIVRGAGGHFSAGDDLFAAVEADLRETLRARFSVRRVAPGTLPVAEHKTRTVHRGKDPFA